MTTLSHVSPLLPWSVLRDALHGFRKVVAADLGFKSATHVDRWCSEPADIDGDGSDQSAATHHRDRPLAPAPRRARPRVVDHPLLQSELSAPSAFPRAPATSS
jgi:hypothetical protein